MPVYSRPFSETKFRIALRHDGVLRRFISYWVAIRSDGSLYLLFDRKGKTDYWSWTAGPEGNSNKTLSTEQTRGFRLSCHTTGMLNPWARRRADLL
ncbi:hypothetical protein SAMN05216338_10907 [Bradyrhizobium sp. Rc2d]|nr:hypothetical protein SAMN05216338_10907 [Bradyrhizobium sp. Rc2d]